MPSRADSSVIGRMKHLLSSAIGADVHFLVGKEGAEREVLPAHKSILLSASDVFEAMFRFDAKNAKRAKNASSEVVDTVEIVDVEPATFKTMLSFIYADDLSELCGDNALAVLCAAKKYNIVGLYKACMEFRISNISNIFLMLAEARLLDEDFAARCLSYIDENADIVLISEEFLNIDQQLLCDILDRKQLTKIGGEMALWNAALRWADAQCCQEGLECTGANRRAVLGPAMHKIRLPLIPREEFTTKIVPSGVLSSDEVVSVFLYHDHPDHALPSQYPLLFPTENRIRVSKSSKPSNYCFGDQYIGL